MPSHLCLSITFLDEAFHGRGDGGEPEWPPSPLRLFQALVAVSAARWRGSEFEECAVPALRWLEAQFPPLVTAPRHYTGVPMRIAVPNNDMDVVASAWAKRQAPKKQPAELKTMKTIRPTRLIGTEAVSYLWQLPAAPSGEILGYLEFLSVAGRQLFVLGWGVDFVAGNGRVLTTQQADALPGERWRPTEALGTVSLRVPVEGTLAALADRHEKFLGRLSGDGLTPIPPLTAFHTVGYQRDTDPVSRPFAAFQLLTLDASRFQPFSSLRQTVAVAGMVRRAASTAAHTAGWSQDRIAAFVLGHGDGPEGQARGPQAAGRFAYLPLPTIEERKTKDQARTLVVGAIRRILVTGQAGGAAEEIAWARRALSGHELIPTDDRTPGAILSLIPESDGRLRHYIRPSSVWSTVTPVVLPGYSDGRPEKTDGLLRKAIEQAGFSRSMAQQAELKWQVVGFLRGVDKSTRYDAPDHLKAYPRLHVRLHWRDAAGRSVEVRGPIVIGGGRYVGMGLFVAPDE